MIVGINPTIKATLMAISLDLPFPTNGISGLSLLTMLLTAPILEEYVLRQGVHSALIHRFKLRVFLRMGLMALLFALLHATRGLQLAIAVLPAGLLLAWLFERARRWRTCALAHAAFNLTWIAFALAFSPAHADALRGKSLYASSPPSGGATCSSCHGVDPAQNISKILKGANNSNLITSAINGNTGGMGILKGKWTATDIADIALYLANPAVTGAPIASLNTNKLSFSATILGIASPAQSITLSNTGNAALNLGGLSISGTNASDFFAVGSGACVGGGSLAAGANCSVSVNFTPQVLGTRSAILTISHALGTSSVDLTGTGVAAPVPTIALNQNSINFGAITQGTTSTGQSITVSNSGQAPLVLSNIALAGLGSAGFSQTGTCAINTPIIVGGSCTLDIRFTPSAVTTYSASLGLSSNASNGTVSVTLLGSGVAVPAPVLSVSPSAIGFGNQTVNSTATAQTITIQNTGNATATLGTPTLSGAASFSSTGLNACGNSLAPATSCSIPIQFRPTVASAQSGTFSIVSNAAGSPFTVTLSGTGVTMPTPSPTLQQTSVYVFAETTVGQQSSALSTVAGNSGTAAYTISQVNVVGPNASEFFVSGDCIAGKLMASASTCNLIVKFAPQGLGLRLARINLLTDSGATLGFDVQGSAKAVATTSGQVNPSVLDFGNVVTGNTSGIKRAAISNTGNQALVVQSISLSASYALQIDTTTCQTMPFTLAPGAQCDLAIKFSPASAGVYTSALTLTTALPGPVMTIALTASASEPIVTLQNPSSVPPSTATVQPSITTANATTETASSPSPVSAPSTSESISNVGKGGCTMSETGNDPSMILLLLAALITGWRRRSFTHGTKTI